RTQQAGSCCQGTRVKFEWSGQYRALAVVFKKAQVFGIIQGKPDFNFFADIFCRDFVENIINGYSCIIFHQAEQRVMEVMIRLCWDCHMALNGSGRCQVSHIPCVCILMKISYRYRSKTAEEHHKSIQPASEFFAVTTSPQ